MANWKIERELFSGKYEKGKNYSHIANELEEVKDYDTSYSATNISLIVNNNGRLIEMKYTIDGISNCEFEENNGSNEYKAQFTFKNTYKYEFKY